jgi:hypothetical protein
VGKFRVKLGGNPDATLKEARAVLKKARDEAKGQERSLRTRQAAEKVWLAASTAADTMIGGKVEKSAHVFSAFERAWGAEGRALAEEIEGTMHRMCFYSNAPVCRGPFVDKYAERLGRLFRKPIRDSEIRKRLAKRNSF